jgi:hypothetical protein
MGGGEIQRVRLQPAPAPRGGRELKVLFEDNGRRDRAGLPWASRQDGNRKTELNRNADRYRSTDGYCTYRPMWYDAQ